MDLNGLERTETDWNGLSGLYRTGVGGCEEFQFGSMPVRNQRKSLDSHPGKFFLLLASTIVLELIEFYVNSPSLIKLIFSLIKSVRLQAQLAFHL